jgi:hypothetical protein
MFLILQQALSTTPHTFHHNQNRPPRPSDLRGVYSIARRRRPVHSLSPPTPPTIPLLGATSPPSPMPPQDVDSTPPSSTSFLRVACVIEGIDPLPSATKEEDNYNEWCPRDPMSLYFGVHLLMVVSSLWMEEDEMGPTIVDEDKIATWTTARGAAGSWSCLSTCSRVGCRRY